MARKKHVPVEVAEPVYMSKSYYAARMETLAYMIRDGAPEMVLQEAAINLVVDAIIQGQRMLEVGA